MSLLLVREGAERLSEKLRPLVIPLDDGRLMLALSPDAHKSPCTLVRPIALSSSRTLLHVESTLPFSVRTLPAFICLLQLAMLLELLFDSRVHSSARLVFHLLVAFLGTSSLFLISCSHVHKQLNTADRDARKSLARVAPIDAVMPTQPRAGTSVLGITLPFAFLALLLLGAVHCRSLALVVAAAYALLATLRTLGQLLASRDPLHFWKHVVANEALRLTDYHAACMSVCLALLAFHVAFFCMSRRDAEANDAITIQTVCAALTASPQELASGEGQLSAAYYSFVTRLVGRTLNYDPRASVGQRGEDQTAREKSYRHRLANIVGVANLFGLLFAFLLLAILTRIASFPLRWKDAAGLTAAMGAGTAPELGDNRWAPVLLLACLVCGGLINIATLFVGVELFAFAVRGETMFSDALNGLFSWFSALDMLAREASEGSRGFIFQHYLLFLWAVPIAAMCGRVVTALRRWWRRRVRWGTTPEGVSRALARAYEAARAAGIGGARIRIVPDEQIYIGCRCPILGRAEVHVSTQALNKCTEIELAALFAHESYHLHANVGSLRVAKCFSLLGGYPNLVGELLFDFARAEFLADAHAVAVIGKSAPLERALLKASLASRFEDGVCAASEAGLLARWKSAYADWCEVASMFFFRRVTFAYTHPVLCERLARLQQTAERSDVSGADGTKRTGAGGA